MKQFTTTHDLAKLSTIQQLTPRILSQQFGATERWWQRRTMELLKLGILIRKGRLFWGRLADVESWLASNQEAPDKG